MAKKNLKVKDIENLENTSMAALMPSALGAENVHVGDQQTSVCCVGTACTFGGVCCTGYTCVQCSVITCVIGCTGNTCGDCTGVTAACVANTNQHTADYVKAFVHK